MKQEQDQIKNSDKRKVLKFTDLKVWQEAHKIVLRIYSITNNFPREELYGLSSQMRRAAVSITANIAEGFGRYHYKEKIRFYYISRSSGSELQSEVMVARDVKYITGKMSESIVNELEEVKKMINGLITSARSKVK